VIRMIMLAVAVVVVGLVLGALARSGVFPSVRSATNEPVAPHDTTIALTWDGAHLVPERLRVPRDFAITLVVRSTAAEFGGHLVIPDYGAEAPFIALVPGATRDGRFVTRRPGDGFEIMVGGKPAGRLDVLGEHLEEERR
jgi:hypothetical protein